MDQLGHWDPRNNIVVSSPGCLFVCLIYSRLGTEKATNFEMPTGTNKQTKCTPKPYSL